MSAWRAYLWLESSTRDLAELEQALGASSPGGHSRGDLRRGTTQRYASSSWRRELRWNAEAHGGVDGIDNAVSALDRALAAHIRALVEAGDHAGLMIVQRIEGADPVGSLGFSLSSRTISWLSEARAGVQIDQYADLGDPDDAL